jgi:endonuclease-3
MIAFYDTYSSIEFKNIFYRLRLDKFVQSATAQIENGAIVRSADERIVPAVIVQSLTAQLGGSSAKPHAMPDFLSLATFTNHAEIINRCRSMEEKVFYILYSAHERLKFRELRRAIVTQTYESVMSKEKKVSKALKEKYPDAESLAKADPSDVEEMIRTIGLYKNKSKNIVKMAAMLCENCGGEVPADFSELVKLPGVGRKTANVILNNCFDVPAFAVDTHVSRVARRLQIANAEDDVLTIEKKLMAFFPKERWGRLHHQFIFFGRYKCKAIKPDCDGCPLKEYCNHLA